jgi:hypothetical protein
MNKIFTVFHNKKNREVTVYNRNKNKVLIEDDDELMTVPYNKFWKDRSGSSILLDISGWKEPGFGNNIHKYIGNIISIFEPIEGDIIKKYASEKAIGEKYIYLLDEKVYIKNDNKKIKHKLKMKVIISHLGKINW